MQIGHPPILRPGTIARQPRAGTQPPAGQALQRVLLTATLRGLAASPLTQPLEAPDAWLVRDPRPGFEHPQMIFRLGYGLPVPPSPRRPVSEVLDT